MEESMSKRKECKLWLNKTTIGNLDRPLGIEEQRAVKGGGDDPKFTTVAPVICQP
jgi:hypothetical protein